MKNILEKQNQIWVLFIGIVLIVYGFYTFADIKSVEEAGRTVCMSKALRIVYNLGGKYAILALFEVIGVFALISGIQQLRGKM